MIAGLRIALFVEGSESPPNRRGRQVLESIWNGNLVRVLNLPPFDLVAPISKTNLIAMDPGNPPMSGAGEKLDQLMARILVQHPYDVAVVAWDLVPAWNPHGEFCRWSETKDLYRFLANSDCLPRVWVDHARRRSEELSQRSIPNDRRRLPSLEHGMVLPVCMEPVFEDILVQDEGAMRRALGIEGKSIKEWPRKGWGDLLEMRPDLNVLTPAIRSLRTLNPRPSVLRIIHGDMRTHKSEWGEFILRKLLEDSRSRPLVLDHPVVRRLGELLARS